MYDAFRWTRDFYAFFGVATAIMMFQDGGWTNANTYAGFLFLGLVYVVLRSFFTVVMEKAIEKIDGRRAERWREERSHAHPRTRRDTPDPGRKS